MIKRRCRKKRKPKKKVYPTLWNADPKCKHNIIDNFYGGGGIKCTKCGGWCCY